MTLASGLLLLLACIAGAAQATESQTAAVSATHDAGAKSYKLDTGDKLRVIVFGDDNLGGEYDVDDGGYVRMPLIGQVKAAGLDLHEFESVVEDKLKAGYLNDPRVSVEVINYRPFYIIGEVNKPGEYPYVNGMNVLTAVALAGGFTYRADDSSVYVRRKGAPDESAEPADQVTAVQPGDILRVPERFF